MLKYVPHHWGSDTWPGKDGPEASQLKVVCLGPAVAAPSASL